MLLFLAASVWACLTSEKAEMNAMSAEALSLNVDIRLVASLLMLAAIFRRLPAYTQRMLKKITAQPQNCRH